MWYPGTISRCYANGCAHVSYDDGDTWTGSGLYMYKIPPDELHFQGHTSAPRGQNWMAPQAIPLAAAPVVMATAVVVGPAGESVASKA